MYIMKRKCLYFYILLMVLVLAKTLMACGEDTKTGQVVEQADSPDMGSSPDLEPMQDLAPEDPPAPPSDDWCTRVVSGDSGSQDIPLEWSAAHAQVRFFGSSNSYHDVDEALSVALDGGEPFTDPFIALEKYADELDAVCALSSTPLAEVATSVEMHGDVAVIVPGVGEPSIPEDATTVIFDLRQLAEAPNMESVLSLHLAAMLTSPVARPIQKVRQHNGMIDEVFAPSIGGTNVFTMRMTQRTLESWPAQATQARRIVIWTGPRLSALGAEIAGTLRLSGDAWLIGESVRTEVAESAWSPIGDAGLAWHARDLLYEDGTRWPDQIPADMRLWKLEDILAAVPSMEMQPPPLVSNALLPLRASIETFDPILEPLSGEVNQGRTRAALITAHGAARAFFPFFSEVGNGINPKLKELLDETSQESGLRSTTFQLLQRLGHTLHDGHCNVRDLNLDETSSGADFQGALPVSLVHIEGKPVVWRSAHAIIQPGDEILTIDGASVEDIYEARFPFISAATSGNQLYQASFQLVVMKQSATYEIRKPDGTQQSVEVTPEPFEVWRQLQPYTVAVTRQSGFLDDLEADDIFYFNLDGEVTRTDAEILDHLLDAFTAQGLVLDMRGYPSGWFAPLRLIGDVIGEDYGAPVFGTPTYTGHDDYKLKRDRQDYNGPREPEGAFAGPVSLIVGPTTQSKAENLSMGLVTEGRATVIGGQSSGTNGNITGLRLPGGFSITFTGLHVLFADGSTFHGIGIQPDIKVEYSREDLVQGLDRPLLEAINAVR